MAKPIVGLALGGGGAKGWAHIGIIKALAAQGIVPDVVAGTSIGAVVGGAYCAGQLPQLEAWVRELHWSQVVRLLDVRLSGGLIQGDKVFGELGAELEGLGFKDLQKPFGAVATDLERGTEVWFRNGKLLPAIRASAALPGLFSPSLYNGQWLVDGGLVNPVPVSMCRALGADFVIAVDLNGDNLSQRTSTEAPAEPQAELGVEKVPSSNSEQHSVLDSFGTGFGMRSKFYDLVEGVVDKLKASGSDVRVPSMVDVAVRSVNIMSIRIARSRLAGDPPDILLRPLTQEIGLLEFHRAEEVIALGESEMDRQMLAVTALRTALEETH